MFWGHGTGEVRLRGPNGIARSVHTAYSGEPATRVRNMLKDAAQVPGIRTAAPRESRYMFEIFLSAPLRFLRRLFCRFVA